MSAGHSIHFDLDGAWPRDTLPGAIYADARALGPHVRYSSTPEAMAEFQAFVARHPAHFTLLGSGDFHHLVSALLLRIEEAFSLVSFDNHPDWDIRPPRWCCGTWINRALERPELEHVSIWGCGNFELNWPSSLFANHRALRAGRMEVWPWAERLPARTRRKWRTITREGWRDDFAAYAAKMTGRRVYITVDLDSLCAEESVTNWENGLFTAADVAWAVRLLRRTAKLVGGDVCGAYSEPVYARFKQGIEARLDHPKHPPVDLAEAQLRNLVALQAIWPALAGGDEPDAGGDEPHAGAGLRGGAAH
jgi:hypothetical protein